MFTPNQIEAIPLGLEKTFDELQTNIMSDIVRRLKANNGEITRSADWQLNRLYELGASKEQLQDYVQAALGASDAEIAQIFGDVIESGYVRDEGLYKHSGVDFIPYDQNEGLQQLVSAVKEQTSGELKNITQSLGFAVRQPDGTLAFKPIANFYQQTLDKAAFEITSGTFDYNTVLKRTIAEMTNSGLRSVDYASGWSNRVPVAARRAVMTGFNQVVSKVNDDNAKVLDTEHFEISYHGGARPTHQVWQGKVYTKAELESVCGLGSVTGLCGANCYHSYSPFIPGVSERIYTDEQLAEMNAKENTPKEYGGKEYTTYEALQRQRKLETAMRAQRQQIKLLQDGNADEEDIINARARYRATSAEYSRFSNDMDLPQQRERIYGDGLGNIGVGKHTKAVDEAGKSGIINKKNYAKASDTFLYGKLSESVTIKPQEIIDRLEESEAGREALSNLKEKGVRPILDYEKHPFSHRGEQQGNIIKIYIDNIDNVTVAAQTIVHEATHLYFNIGQCQWAEAVCMAKEKMFLTGKPLTFSEKKYIVRLAKKAYPEFSWKKGGYGYKRK